MISYGIKIPLLGIKLGNVCFYCFPLGKEHMVDLLQMYEPEGKGKNIYTYVISNILKLFLII